MITRQCLECGKDFSVEKPSRPNKFCSHKCYGEHHKTGPKYVSKPCAQCGKPIFDHPCHMRCHKFCSAECREQYSVDHLAERFWEKVDKSGEQDACWLWTGAIMKPSPYGAFWKDKGKHSISAHQMAWILISGSIPDGMCVLHKCDNPICCNPSHLWLGTLLENVADMVNKGRQARGERIGNAKLIDDKVRIIRRMYGEGMMQKTIAIIIGVSGSSVNAVISGRTWRHVK